MAEDFSEFEHLAAKLPETLAELVDRWWMAAEKYHVLPSESTNRHACRSPRVLVTDLGSIFQLPTKLRSENHKRAVS